MRRFKTNLAWIPRGIWGISAANMLIAISTSMTFSISPYFMTQVLALSVGVMAVVEGVAEGSSQISKLFSGISGDLFRRRKPTLWVGFLLTVLSKPIFILSKGSLGWAFIITSKLMERISNGVIATPRDAYIADNAPKGTKGASFGIMMTSKTLGCTIGSYFIAILLHHFSQDYQLLLWFGFVPCLLSLFVLWKFVDEEEEPETIMVKEENKLHFRDIKLLSFRYWSLIIIAGIFMSARFSDGFLILRLKQLGELDSLAASAIGTFNIISTLCCFPIGRLSDTINRSTMLYFSFISLVLANVCFVFATEPMWGWVGVIFWGAQRGTSQILFSAIISDEAPRKIIGTAIGMFYITTGLVSIGAGYIIYKLMGSDNVKIAFEFGLVVSTLALVGLFLRGQMVTYMERRGDSGTSKGKGDSNVSDSISLNKLATEVK